MTTRSQQRNKFRQLKEKIESCKADIIFLKECRKSKVYPKFMTIIIKINNSRVNKVINYARNMWFKCEINYLYAKIQTLSNQLYSVHLSLTKNLTQNSYNEWILFISEFNEILEHKMKSKQALLYKKFKLLKNQFPDQKRISTNFLPNFVNNFSSETFTSSEMDILNKGLKYGLPPKINPIEDIVINLESSIKYLPMPKKEEIRRTVMNKIVKEDLKNIPIKQNVLIQHKLMNELRKKEVYYMKADKSNAIVILDKKDYDGRMLKLISEGPYELINNPLNKFQNHVSSIISELEKYMEKSWKWKMKVSNSKIPILYGLPKLHKVGEKMRPIVSNIGSPCYNLSKWLVKELNNLKEPKNFSVKNSLDFLSKVKNLKIGPDELLVSFDVTSLFPSIPIFEALEAFDEWIDEQINISPGIRLAFSKVAELCMGHNYFQFRNKFYRQTDGTSMGNSLSPFIANIYMAKFEMNLSKNAIFPRFWIRYVDDIFAVVKKGKMEETLNFLNNQNPKIQFTCETEKNNTLPFLDIEITRKEDLLDFNIYRKPTNTLRYITNESYHNYNQKSAAFNSMIFRLCNFPLSPENYNKELDFIIDIAKKNGYQKSFVTSLVKKQHRKLVLKNLTTHLPTIKSPNKYIALPYFPPITKHLENCFKDLNFKPVYKNSNKIQHLLGTTKDKKEAVNKSGIYEIKCGSKKCKMKYVGMTKRSILTRFKEHNSDVINKRIEKSGLAEHVVNTHKHRSLSMKNLKLLKEINDERKLAIAEAIEIKKRKPLTMNRDEGEVRSCLVDLF